MNDEANVGPLKFRLPGSTPAWAVGLVVVIVSVAVSAIGFWYVMQTQVDKVIDWKMAVEKSKVEVEKGSASFAIRMVEILQTQVAQLSTEVASLKEGLASKSERLIHCEEQLNLCRKK